jgi:hypothetical protein
MSSGPNILGSSAARDWPSPCSPESEPPKEHDIRGALNELAEHRMPSTLRKVEIDARVNAALAVVTVERAAVPYSAMSE